MNCRNLTTELNHKMASSPLFAVITSKPSASRLKSRMLIHLVVLLGIMASPVLAASTQQKEAHQLSDSLATWYASEGSVEGTAAFDPATAVLEDYLAYAAKNSPSLRAAFYQWVSLLEKSDYAGALPSPNVSYTYFIENVETRVGPQNHAIRLRQAFPWFGTLGAKKDMTFEAANSAYQAYQSEKFTLFYRVKSAYYDYYFLGRDIAITRENMELLRFWESIVRAKYRVALKKHPDVIRAQVELGKLEDRLRTLENMAKPVSARLREIMNLSDDIQLPVPEFIVVEEAEVFHDEIISNVLEHNPDLKSLRHLIDKEEAGIRFAGKLSWPSFVVGMDYIATGEAIDPQMLDSGKDPWTVSIGLSLPIWFGANKAKKKEAEARHRKSTYDHISAQNRLKTYTENALFEYEDALRKSRLYRDGLVPKAEQSLNANYTAYQAGETDFLNLLDTQRQLLDFQLEFERSQVNLASSRARLEMLLGKELPHKEMDHE